MTIKIWTFELDDRTSTMTIKMWTLELDDRTSTHDNKDVVF
jgi:hypothetical protein